ncbi:putative MAMMALIAN LYST-INTERACTING PROTEIN 5 [Cardamine amara subsp. amara]|uniref:MAMMALIAN LYST-INTERACTING PROTEIN 5 n=1 Tax=Cardamine amara subsp. amara TaxID=228776 RepID=A0ABD1ANA0_CARAN
MSNPNEPAKTLLPYLQRADELQKHEPLVAYYCRLYAMERGLKIPQSERTKTTNSILMSLINQLEKDKKSLNLSPDDNMHVEGFALNVFAKADKQDRAGRADLSTAKTFYAASIFFEILSQFGPVPPDIEQKQKYAIWKAADIRKAIKEGRKPTPGDPVDDDNDDLSIPSSGPSGSHDIGPSDTNITSHHRTEPDHPSHDSNNDSSHHHFPEVPQHPLPPRFHDNPNDDYPTDVPPPPPSSYSSNDLLPPPMGPPSDSPYPHPYSHQPYHQDPPQHMPPPQNYPSHEPSPNSLPNFQSYPSFSESSLPSTPSQYPSHYPNPDPYYSSPHSAPAPSSTSFASAPPPPYSSSNGRTNIAPVVDPAPSPAQKYHYDSSYQPGPEKIAEAHKAARFAVGALAFDEVATAVAHLTKSLELLTNPSAGH